MKNNLSLEQIQSYRENGFLTIEGFLDPIELEQWRHDTDEAVAQRLAKAGMPSVNFVDSLTNENWGDDYYKQVFVQCIRLADSHEGMRELLFDPRLGKMAAELAGVEGIRIYHDTALIKGPHGNPTAWHVDNPLENSYYSFTNREALSIWIALDDATLGNGCLWYIPGTHKLATVGTAGIGSSMSDLFKVYPQWAEMETVSIPVPAGSAVFHNVLTAHGAGANMTNKQRRAMTCQYMPDGSTFNGQQGALPKDYVDSLKIGDVLNNDVWNKLIWPVD